MNLNELNPISIMREDARKTQLEIADLLNIGDQVVRKQELGLTNTPNTAVIKILLEFLPRQDFIRSVAACYAPDLVLNGTNTEMQRKYLALKEYSKKYYVEGDNSHAVDVIVKWYEMWQLAKRLEFKREIFPGLSEFKRPPEMSKTEYRLLLMSFAKKTPGAQWFTPYAFCSRLSIHPATLARWEKTPEAVSPVMDSVLGTVDSRYTHMVFARARVSK